MKLYVLDLSWEGSFVVVANSMSEARNKLCIRFELTLSLVEECSNFIKEYEITEDLAYTTAGDQ